jgi:hypothetical protein
MQMFAKLLLFLTKNVMRREGLGMKVRAEAEEPIRTLALSSICPTSRGQLIPSAFASFQRGMDKEKARFIGKPFVVLKWRGQIDYDSCEKYCEFLEDFDNKFAALEYARQQVETALTLALQEPDHPWQLVSRTTPSSHPLRPDTCTICNVFSESFEVNGGMGYFSREVEIEVLHVSDNEIIGVNLLSFLERESSSLTSYFIERGESAQGG